MSVIGLGRRGGVADEPHDRHQRDQRREQRQQPVVGQRRRPVGHVVLAELGERALDGGEHRRLAVGAGRPVVGPRFCAATLRGDFGHRLLPRNGCGTSVPQRGRSCPAYPAYRDTYSPISRIRRRSHGLGTYVPLVRHTSPSAVTVSPVSEAAQSPEHPDDSTSEPEAAPRRADALVSRQRILAAAAALAGDRRTTMAEIAAAAGVGRSTLYRHFATRAGAVRGPRRGGRRRARGDPAASRRAGWPRSRIRRPAASGAPSRSRSRSPTSSTRSRPT